MLATIGRIGTIRAVFIHFITCKRLKKERVNINYTQNLIVSPFSIVMIARKQAGV
jgi:hypothetical protein